MAVWVQLSKFLYFVAKTNDRLVAVFEILHFAGKNEWPFEYNCKILYFPVKKPLAVWVHAL